eukprot:3811989-Heterocapsa_arctica.AAC.1
MYTFTAHVPGARRPGRSTCSAAASLGHSFLRPPICAGRCNLLVKFNVYVWCARVFRRQLPLGSRPRPAARTYYDSRNIMSFVSLFPDPPRI